MHPMAAHGAVAIAKTQTTSAAAIQFAMILRTNRLVSGPDAAVRAPSTAPIAMVEARMERPTEVISKLRAAKAGMISVMQRNSAPEASR